MSVAQGASIRTLSRLSASAWIIFFVSAVSELPRAGFRIYWVWTFWSLVAIALLFLGVRRNQGLELINVFVSIGLFATYALYYFAIGQITTAHESTGLMFLVSRLENMAYVVLMNLEQIHIWMGIKTLYIQFLMPVFQFAVLVVAGWLLARRRQTAEA